MTSPSDPTGAPIIVSALFGDADHAALDGLRRAHFPPARNQLAAHLTLFHHLPPGVGDELRQRLAEEARAPRPSARLAGIMTLGGGTAFRVESEALTAIRARLADAFTGLLMPQDKAGWRPHVTIQNKVTAVEAKALQEELAATFTPRPLVITALAAWDYMGGPWRLRSRHAFRG